MNRKQMMMAIGLVWTLGGSVTRGDDWPQWLGPERDSIWRETGIIDSIPATGLPIKWRTPVGLGYSGPAVAQGRVFVTDYEMTSGEIANHPGGRNELDGKERVQCLDAKSGRVLWAHAYPRKYALSYAAGPRCTPTVDGNRVYTLGAEGDLFCLDTETGKVIWSKSLTQEFKVETPIWGFSAHPLVDGDKLICLVGGEGSVAVAFNKMTGKELWRALSAPEPGYCPPTVIEHAGTRQLLIWHPESLNGLDPETGKVYWTVPLQPDYRMSIAAPRKSGDYLFAGGIGSVAAVLKLDSTKPAAELEWKANGKNAVYCGNSTPLIVDGIIYACDCQLGSLMGVRLADGERLWQTFEPTSGGTKRASHGTAHLVKNGDRYFLFSETGDLILAQLSPSGYKELGRFHVVEPTNECFGRKVVWSHPAFAGRCAFIRNDQEIVCVDLAAPR